MKWLPDWIRHMLLIIDFVQIWIQQFYLESTCTINFPLNSSNVRSAFVNQIVCVSINRLTFYFIPVESSICFLLICSSNLKSKMLWQILPIYTQHSFYCKVVMNLLFVYIDILASRLLAISLAEIYFPSLLNGFSV